MKIILAMFLFYLLLALCLGKAAWAFEVVSNTYKFDRHAERLELSTSSLKRFVGNSDILNHFDASVTRKAADFRIHLKF